MPADKLRSHVENLSKQDEFTGETGFENEFKVCIKCRKDLSLVNNYLYNSDYLAALMYPNLLLAPKMSTNSKIV